MRVFVTGGSGFIGSAVVPELIKAGHEVVGLARSDASADALATAGAQVRRGGLDDLDVLREGAADSDGVIHLAFIHDFSRFAESARADRRAIETFADALEGSGRPLVIASGTLALPYEGVAAESPALAGEADDDSPASARAHTAAFTLGLSGRGVRSVVVGLPPTVHGEGDHGFVAALINIAREKGVSGYLGDGANRWGAVHRLDAARAFRLALEDAPAGAALQAIAEEGVPTREIAEVVGRHLGVPAVSVPRESAEEHFGWLGAFFGRDVHVGNPLTREMLGWAPTGPGLLEDLDQGHYFA